MNSAVLFGKASDLWQTPEEAFNVLNAEFGFDHDAASLSGAGWVDGDYFGPDHSNALQRDALTVENWRAYGERHFLNMPYSKCRQFIAKAAHEARTHGCTVVCTPPARTDTQWWHRHVYDTRTETWRPGVEVRFVEGRWKFLGPDKEPIRDKKGRAVGAPFPTAIIIFRPVGVVA